MSGIKPLKSHVYVKKVPDKSNQVGCHADVEIPTFGKLTYVQDQCKLKTAKTGLPRKLDKC